MNGRTMAERRNKTGVLLEAHWIGVFGNCDQGRTRAHSATNTSGVDEPHHKVLSPLGGLRTLKETAV